MVVNPFLLDGVNGSIDLLIINRVVDWIMFWPLITDWLINEVYAWSQSSNILYYSYRLSKSAMMLREMLAFLLLAYGIDFVISYYLMCEPYNVRLLKHGYITLHTTSTSTE